MNRDWAKAIAAGIGALLYVAFYIGILVVTYRAKPGQTLDFGFFGATALTMSAAIGGYLAKLLGVTPPTHLNPFTVTPSQFVNVVILLSCIAYVLIGAGCAYVNWVQHTHPELVADAVSAGWKVPIGLIVASFLRTFT